MTETNKQVVAQEQDGSKDAAQASAPQVLAVLIDENPLIRTGLRHLLSGTHLVVSETSCGDRLPDYPSVGPVLFITSASYWSAKTVETIKRLKEHYPAGRVCMLADQFDLSHVMEAQEAGVDGFCLMMSDREVLARSLELIALGEDLVPSKVVLSVVSELSRQAESPKLAPTEMAKVASPIAHKLSAREGEILRGLMEGEPNKVIARRFGLSEATVKVHVKAILRKIGAKNRTQAAMWASDQVSTELDAKSATGTPGRTLAGEHHLYR